MPVFAHLVLVQQGVEDGLQVVGFLDELPDAGAHLVQPEVVLGLQVEQYGFARHFLGNYIR